MVLCFLWDFFGPKKEVKNLFFFFFFLVERFYNCSKGFLRVFGIFLRVF